MVGLAIIVPRMTIEETYHTMYDCVFAEQDDLAGWTDEPFGLLVLVSELFSLCLCFRRVGQRCAHELVLGRVERDSTSVVERVLQVIEQVRRILDTNAKADEVFRKPTLLARLRIDRCVSTNT